MKRTPRLVPALALCAALAAPSAAKVAFTGYGNLVLSADSQARIRGPASVLGTTPESNLVSKGFRVDAAGLFATTKVGEDAEFLLDLTFRNVGAAVGQTRIQYAYLDAGLPWGGLRAQAGKITLPFGYYNSRRFYPFQRVELTAPVYISSILGLPIADAGLALSRRFDLDADWGVDVRAYGVNGYSSVSGSTAALRNPALPGGLGMSGNLGAGNNNKDIAWGGQVALSRDGTGEIGTSYYRGAWDPQGRRVLQMASAHGRWTPGKLDLLAEYLYVHATGDEGFQTVLGSPNWRTHGAFVSVSHPLFPVRGRTVDGYARGESYSTGRVGGGDGHEVLRSAAGGVASRVSENLLLKGELLWLDYYVPFTAQKSARLEGRVVQLAAVVTF